MILYAENIFRKFFKILISLFFKECDSWKILRCKKSMRFMNLYLKIAISSNLLLISISLFLYKSILIVKISLYKTICNSMFFYLKEVCWNYFIIFKLFDFIRYLEFFPTFDINNKCIISNAKKYYKISVF